MSSARGGATRGRGRGNSDTANAPRNATKSRSRIGNNAGMPTSKTASSTRNAGAGAINQNSGQNTAKLARNGTQPSNKAMTKTQTADSWLPRFQALNKARDQERNDAIKEGLMADPEKPRALSDAITLVGTCQDMCAEYERVQRVVQRDVWPEERVVEHSEYSTGEREVDESRMVKKFRRSAAGLEEQLPSDLRPPAVLKRTCDYLFDEIVGEATDLASVHHFVWDRTRAIRNDFSIQEVTRVEDLKIAIDCYERIARFHIVSLHTLAGETRPYHAYDAQQEREQLDRTMLSLTQYYDDCRRRFESPNEPEFRAYSILFQIQVSAHDVEDRVQTWPLHILRNPRVLTALDIFAAAGNNLDPQGPLRPRTNQFISQQDWEHFWALVASKRVSFLMGCVAEIYFNLVRRTVLNALWRAFRVNPRIADQYWSPAILMEMFAYDDESEVRKFCESYGFSFRDRQDGDGQYLDLTSVRERDLPTPEKTLISQTRSSLVESKRLGRSVRAVINGLTVVQARAAGLIAEDEMDDEMLYSSQLPNQFADDDLGISDTADSPLFVPSDATIAKTSTLSPFAPQIALGQASAVESKGSFSFGKPSANSEAPAMLSPFAPSNSSSIFSPGLNRNSPFAVSAAPLDLNPSSTTKTTSPFNFNAAASPEQLSMKPNTALSLPGTTSSDQAASKSKSSPFAFLPSKDAPPVAAKEKSSPIFSLGPVNTDLIKGAEKETGSGLSLFASPASNGPHVGTSPFPTTVDNTSKSLFDAFSFKSPLTNTNPNDKSMTNGTGLSPSSMNATASNSSTQQAMSPTAGSMFTKAGPEGPTSFDKDQTGPSSVLTQNAFSPPNITFSWDQPKATEQPLQSKADDEPKPAKSLDLFSPSSTANAAHTTDKSILTSPISPTNSPSPPSSSAATFASQTMRKSSFSQDTKPKKPSPLSNSFSAAEEPSEDSAAKGKHMVAKKSQAVVDVAPRSDRPTLASIVDRLSREITTAERWGLLDQFIEFEVGRLVTSIQEEVYMEQIEKEAATFRHRVLSCRYGLRWKELYWRRRRVRHGRQRRARARQSLLDSKAQVADFATTRRGLSRTADSSHASHGRTEESYQDVAILSRQSRESSVASSIQQALLPRNSHHQSADRIMSTQAGARQPDESSQFVKPAPRYPLPSKAEPSPMRRSAFLGYALPYDARDRSSTTQTNYFRLKALGLGHTNNAYTTKRGAKRQRTSSIGTTSDVSPPSSKRPSVPSSSPEARLSAIPAVTEKQATPGNEDDEALFARLHAARQGLIEATQFIKQETTKRFELSPKMATSPPIRYDSPSLQRARIDARLNQSQQQHDDSLRHEDVPAYRLRESRFVPREQYGRAKERADEIRAARSQRTSLSGDQEVINSRSPSQLSYQRELYTKTVRDDPIAGFDVQTGSSHEPSFALLETASDHGSRLDEWTEAAPAHAEVFGLPPKPEYLEFSAEDGPFDHRIQPEEVEESLRSSFGARVPHSKTSDDGPYQQDLDVTDVLDPSLFEHPSSQSPYGTGYGSDSKTARSKGMEVIDDPDIAKYGVHAPSTNGINRSQLGNGNHLAGQALVAADDSRASHHSSFGGKDDRSVKAETEAEDEESDDDRGVAHTNPFALLADGDEDEDEEEEEEEEDADKHSDDDGLQHSRPHDSRSADFDDNQSQRSGEYSSERDGGDGQDKDDDVQGMEGELEDEDGYADGSETDELMEDDDDDEDRSDDEDEDDRDRRSGRFVSYDDPSRTGHAGHDEALQTVGGTEDDAIELSD